MLGPLTGDADTDRPTVGAAGPDSPDYSRRL